ncbi:hypothetical protein [Flavobacterium sp. 5]|uniref:hypothetical protein n=1 Tax=Flavobacterium sp. 5 TaxID=2035199 RepID=UPI000C2BDFEA|nr:hypothetical protein [Flavobacterium sp. 5]PKB18371.1 hypothetical protein CLU82_3646 [Flavobacterium sp. 5]
MNNSVQKLRIYAMIMRLQEIERERIMKPFLPKIIMKPFIEVPILQLYDKKGKPFDLPKSKYHK